jgi:(+)-pinoresinol hydroxylase
MKHAVVLLLLAPNFSAIAVESTQASQPLTDDQSRGRSLFNESCSFCHGERGHATTLLAKRLGTDNAVLERRTNLSAELIRHVTRHGINSMPWYRRAELSDSDLELIITYLTRTTSRE